MVKIEYILEQYESSLAWFVLNLVIKMAAYIT